MLHLKLQTSIQTGIKTQSLVVPKMARPSPMLCPLPGMPPQPLLHPVNLPADSFGPEYVRSVFFSSPLSQTGQSDLGLGGKKKTEKVCRDWDEELSLPSVLHHAPHQALRGDDGGSRSRLGQCHSHPKMQ